MFQLPTNGRSRVALAVAACALLVGAAPLTLDRGDRDEDQSERGVRPGESASQEVASGEHDDSALAIDPAAVREAVDRALTFLVEGQQRQADGSFPAAGAEQYTPVATSALCALALMAAGNTSGRGRYHAAVEAAIDYLLARVDLAPSSKTLGYIADPGRDTLSRTHGHGFALLALTQAFTVSPRTPRGRRLARAIPLAVALVENSQGVEGGWYYGPTRGLQHEGSVTIGMVQSLRAAKGAGFHVSMEVIAKAVDYVERSQKEDGSFRYALGDDRSSIALTAAALATLQASGNYDGRELASGFDYLERELAARSLGVGSDQGPMFRKHYEQLYLTQAYWQHPDPRKFQNWYAAGARALIGSQSAAGSWHSAEYGDSYATAISVLILTLPDGLLPIFQR